MPTESKLTTKEALKIHEVVKTDPVLAKPGAPDHRLRRRTLTNARRKRCSIACTPPQGIGLAAPQIAISQHITVIDISFKKNPEDNLVLINPEIIDRRGKQSKKKAASASPRSAKRYIAPPGSKSVHRT